MLRLRYWRMHRALTLKDLEARTRLVQPPGIPFQQLSAYERGTVTPPLDRLLLLANALEISLCQLVVPKTDHDPCEEVAHA